MGLKKDYTEKRYRKKLCSLIFNFDLRHKTAVCHGGRVSHTALAGCGGQEDLQRLEALRDPVAGPGRLLLRVRGVPEHHR